MKKPKPLAKSFDEMTRIHKGAIPAKVGCAYCDASLNYGTAASFEGKFACGECLREIRNAAVLGSVSGPCDAMRACSTGMPAVDAGGRDTITDDNTGRLCEFAPGVEDRACVLRHGHGGDHICARPAEQGESFGIVAPAPRKVAIVGFSDTSRDLAPYDDPTFEIWSLGWQMRRAKRLTRGFEIHTEEFLKRVHGDGWPEYQAYLKAMTVTLYMQEGQPYEGPFQRGIEVAYPAAIRFPIERATKACFGTDDPFSGKRPLWTNSIQFMLALAGIEGFQEVHIFGVDMAHRLEYVHQRHGVTLLIGMLMGMGVHVSVPEHCALLHSDHVYGYEEEPYDILTEAAMHLRKDREMRLSQHEAHLAKAQNLAGYTEGQKDAIEYLEERARGGRAEKPIPAEFMR